MSCRVAAVASKISRASLRSGTLPAPAMAPMKAMKAMKAFWGSGMLWGYSGHVLKDAVNPSAVSKQDHPSFASDTLLNFFPVHW